MSQLFPATNMATVRIPSRTTATIYTVRLLPEIGAAFCSCDSFVFSKGPHKSCFHCREALAQFEARQFVQPTAAEIAANEAISPYGETEELLTACRCGYPAFHAANEAAWCDECEDYVERIKAMPLRDYEIKRLNAAAAKLALTPIAHDAQSLANQREMEQIAVEFLEARSFADYAAVLSAPLVTEMTL